MIQILNIPQVCVFNSYISRLSNLQKEVGLFVVDKPVYFRDSINTNLNSQFRSKLIDNLFDSSQLGYKIIHLHWPEKFYKYENSLIFLKELLILKSQGYKIIRTLHNLLPHDTDGELNNIDRELTKLSDIIHVFTSKQKEIIKQRYSSEVVIIPHLNYFETIPKSIIGIKELSKIYKNSKIAFLFFGRLRNYKNIEVFIKSIEINSNENLLFIIAGLPDNKNIEEKITALCLKDDRVIFINRIVNEYEIPSLFLFSDVVVIPYNAWSSGVFTLSLNLRRVIMGKLPASVEFKPNCFLESKIDAVSLSENYDKITKESLSAVDLFDNSIISEGNDKIALSYKKMYSKWI